MRVRVRVRSVFFDNFIWFGSICIYLCFHGLFWCCGCLFHFGHCVLWGGMRGRRLVLLPVRVMVLGIGCVHGVGALSWALVVDGRMMVSGMGWDDSVW